MNEDFNLSTAHETTVKKLAEEIWTKINGEGQPLRLVHDEAFEPDLQRRTSLTLKNREMLGFEATTSLDGMLEEVIPWVREGIDSGVIYKPTLGAVSSSRFLG